MSDREPTRCGVLDSWPGIALLALVFGVVAYGTDMYLPALPAIGRAFSATPEAVQFSLTLFLYGNAAGQLVVGPLSDRFGRKPVLLAGLAAYAAATLTCALANSLETLYLARIGQGATAAAGPVLVRALLADRLERRRAAEMLALLTGLMALLALLTPIAGGWLVRAWGWPAIFFFIAVLACALFAASALVVDESLPASRRLRRLDAASIAGGYWQIARSLAFWCYVLPPALLFASVFAYVGVNSFLLIGQLGMAEHHYGMTYSAAAFAYVCGSFASNRLVHRSGIERACTVALALAVIAGCGSVVASYGLPLSLPLVLVPALATFFATALLVPVASSTAISLFAERAGSASAVAGFVQVLAAGLGTLLAALLVSNHTLPLHVFTVVCAFAAGGVWLASRTLRLRALAVGQAPNASQA